MYKPSDIRANFDYANYVVYYDDGYVRIQGDYYKVLAEIYNIQTKKPPRPDPEEINKLFEIAKKINV